MDQTFKLNNFVLLILLGILFFVIGNSLLSLTNPDEVFYALSAKEMMQQETWKVPYIFGQPQFEKPILTFWLLKSAFTVFGINSFSARLFPAIFGILGCLAVYLFCKNAFRDERKAFFCSVVLMSSLLYFGLSRFVFTDMIFSVWISMSLVAFYVGYIRSEHRANGSLFFFVFSGLAVLTKGLLGVAIPWAAVGLFLLFRRDLKFLVMPWTLLGGVLFLLIVVPWYAFMIKTYGQSFIHEFFYNDHIRRILEAEHRPSDKWFFYPVTIVVGMFPWCVPAAVAILLLFKGIFQRRIENAAYLFLACWVVAAFAIVQIAHSKLSSYILPVMPAIAIVTADYLWSLCEQKKDHLFLAVTIGSFVLYVFGLLTLLLISVGVIPLEPKYYEYLPDVPLISLFLCVSLLMMAAVVFFCLKHQTLKAVYVMALQVPMILFLAFLSHEKFEAYVSSEAVAKDLMSRGKIENKVLCSKMLVRGVRYYTGLDVAVVGEEFFSPHPIEMLDSDELIVKFLSYQHQTYAVVRNAEFEKIKGAAGRHFDITVLKKIGDATILDIRERTSG